MYSDCLASILDINSRVTTPSCLRNPVQVDENSRPSKKYTIYNITKVTRLLQDMTKVMIRSKSQF